MPRRRLYDIYKEKMQKVADINHAIAVLSWDKEVYMPKGGSAARAQQISTLAGLSHSAFTDKEIGNLLERLFAMKSLSEAERRNVEVTHRAYQKATKFEEAFVVKKSKIESACFQAWVAAKEVNDYTVYKDALADLVTIKREEAERLGYAGHPYDAMLDQYEPNLTVEKLDPIFKGVRKDLSKLLKKVKKQPKVKNKFLHKKYDWSTQWEFGIEILRNMGYDFDRGRQDISAHPFTTSFSADDVRVTTRVDEQDFAYMLWSTIHEGGHALYEQGLPPEDYGLPTGSYLSLSIHESQSRLWENHVGRSIDYWTYWYPKLVGEFPQNLSKVSLDKFYKGINKVAPNLIRTEADELHYHFHILIRYEIEKGLMDGTIDVHVLDNVWNEKYKTYLGVEVPDARQGILQDVHWAHGSIGYFPTYSLGSFYAAQFFHQAGKDIKKLDKKLRKGNCAPLLDWLRENIHQHGNRYDADTLCEIVTGEPLNFDYFLSYAREKFLE